MEAIISSIIGAAVGSFITWWTTRQKPHYIICTEEYRRRFHLRIPETRILFRNTPVEKLGIVTLSFRNAGTRAIEQPDITIRLDEKIQILNVFTTISPERYVAKSQQDPDNQLTENNNKEQTIPIQHRIDRNFVKVSIDRLIPHKTNRETVTVDVFADGEIEALAVFGNGVLHDGTAWVLQHKSWKKMRQKTSRVLAIASNTSLIILFILFMVYLYQRIFLRMLPYLNTSSIRQWLDDPLLWVLLSWAIVTFAGHLIGAYQGFGKLIYLPFTSRAFEVWLVKRPKSTE